MKGIVIFDSSYGSTKKIADAVAETLKESSIEIGTYYVKDVKKLSARDYDFLVVGSPTKFGTMSFAMKGFLSKINGKEWKNKPFAAFDTENPENIEKKESSAAEKIAEKLKEKQMEQLLPVLKGIVLGWKGPLQDGETERVKGYTRELVAKLKSK